MVQKMIRGYLARKHLPEPEAINYPVIESSPEPIKITKREEIKMEVSKSTSNLEAAIDKQRISEQL
jgi:hypothetical protein